MRGAKERFSGTQGGEGKESRKLFFFKPSAIVAMLFLAVTALALAYIAGVMSGRHDQSQSVPLVVVQPEKNEEAKDADTPGILAPEDLEFARELRGQTSRKNIPPKETTEEESKAIEEARPAQGSEPLTIPGADAPPLQDAMFDYLVQVAAFKDETGADNLRQKLEGYGYRTIQQKSGSMLVVLVKMRASESGYVEFQNLCRKLNLGDPLLKMKKPVVN